MKGSEIIEANLEEGV